ncbi:MAG: hypothetical protein SFV15_06980 [Polyangiaceae bacterium]|nr:hypothetical protein [Polyangiaceae bacterium]
MGVFRFRLFGFPVHVHPGFWMLALMFGYLISNSVQGALMFLGAFGLCILSHEFGHAVVARAFGQEPVVFLHLFGGLTAWRQTSPLPRWRQIWVALAGPAAGFLLGGLAWGGLIALGVHELPVQSMQESTPNLPTFLATVLTYAFLYSAVNLLPILPMDGGQAMAVFLGPERRGTAATVSLVASLALSAAFFLFNQPLPGLLFGVSGIFSYVHARRTPVRPALPEEALREILARAHALRESERYGEAMAMAMAVFENSPTDAWRTKALDIAGWSAVMAGRAAEARAVLARTPVGQQLDALLEASIRELDGDLTGAAQVLVVARRAGDQRAEVVGALIRIWLKLQEYPKACALAAGCVEQLAEEDVRRVGSETLEAGVFESAAQLFESLFRQSRLPEDALSAARGWVRGGRAELAAVLLGQAVQEERLEWSQVKTEPELEALAPSDG